MYICDVASRIVLCVCVCFCKGSDKRGNKTYRYEGVPSFKAFTAVFRAIKTVGTLRHSFRPRARVILFHTENFIIRNTKNRRQTHPPNSVIT